MDDRDKHALRAWLLECEVLGYCPLGICFPGTGKRPEFYRDCYRAITLAPIHDSCMNAIRRRYGGEGK